MTAAGRERVALVHHWLVTLRGGERVLEALAELFPDADIFTLVCDEARMGPVFSGHRIRTSPLQRLPLATRWYPHYLPLFPWATERLDLRGYPLVISSDAATMKVWLYGDANGTNSLNILDVNLLVARVQGRLSKFPVEP